MLKKYKVTRIITHEVEAPNEDEARVRAAQNDDCDYSKMGWGQTTVEELKD